MLVPLFDRMTTHDLTRRFTADEALEFFQNEYSQLTKEQLGCHTYYDSNRSSSECWDLIPRHLAEKWACHRTPPVPLSYPVLRWLCKRRPMEHVVPWIRWFLSSLVTFPRRVLKSLQMMFWNNEAGFHSVSIRNTWNECWLIMSCHQELAGNTKFFGLLDRRSNMPALALNLNLNLQVMGIWRASLLHVINVIFFFWCWWWLLFRNAGISQD